MQLKPEVLSGRVVALTLAAFVAVCGPGPLTKTARAAETKTTVSFNFRTASTPAAVSSWPYYAAAAQFWPELGLNVTVEPGRGASTVQAVGAGSDQMGFTEFLPAVIAIRSGLPITIIAAPGSRDPDGVVFTKDSGVRDWADLVGKRVGFVPGTSAVSEIRLVLKRKGIDPDSVKWQAIAASSQMSLLKAGKLQIAAAFAGGTDVELGCVGVAAGSLSVYEAGVKSIGQVIIVNNDWAKKVGNDVVARALLGAIRGYLLLKTNPEQVIKDVLSFSPQTPLDSPTEMVQIGLSSWMYRPLDNRHGFAWVDADDMRQGIATLEAAGVLAPASKTAATAYMTTKYLENPVVQAVVKEWSAQQWAPPPPSVREQCGVLRWNGSAVGPAAAS